MPSRVPGARRGVGVPMATTRRRSNREVRNNRKVCNGRNGRNGQTGLDSDGDKEEARREVDGKGGENILPNGIVDEPDKACAAATEQRRAVSHCGRGACVARGAMRRAR